MLYRAIRAFQEEGKATLSLGLSPLCCVEDRELSSNRLMSFAFRTLYHSRLFNQFIYPIKGFAKHKGAFGGMAVQTYCALKRGRALSQLVKMPRACNVA